MRGNDLLMDADASLNSFCDDFAQGDECLDHVDDRLHALRSVARKHGCLVAELPDIHESMSQELKTVKNFSARTGKNFTEAKSKPGMIFGLRARDTVPGFGTATRTNMGAKKTATRSTRPRVNSAKRTRNIGRKNI